MQGNDIFNNKGHGQGVLCNSDVNYTYLGLEISKEGIGVDKQRKVNEREARRMSCVVINAGGSSIKKYKVGRNHWNG